MQNVVFVSALVSLAPNVACAASGRDDFDSPSLIATATADIQQMAPLELEQFITYLAACGAFGNNELKRFYCSRERQSYLIKFERGRALDRLVAVGALMSNMIDLQEKTTKPNTKERAELDKIKQRHTELTRRLNNSANSRYRELHAVN